MRVTEVTSFHRVSAVTNFDHFKKLPTHYVSSFTKLGGLVIFALSVLPLLLELP